MNSIRHEVRTILLWPFAHTEEGQCAIYLSKERGQQDKEITTVYD